MKPPLPQEKLLQETFYRIHRDRMMGLPFLNPALDVQTVGFHRYADGVLGVLITPWFMNLILLPDQQVWEMHQVGEKVLHVFPSGQYEFTVGNEAGVGKYQMCSLFSPMSHFVDQTAAVATAEAVLVALMDKQYVETLDQYQEWEAGTSPAASAPSTLSRRALLPGLAGAR